MPRELVVGTQTFEYPEQGDNAGWGEQATEWAAAVTEVLSTVQQPGDILPIETGISNNQSSATNVVGLSFNPTIVASFIATYYIERSTVSPANFVTESGTLSGVYNGSSWDWTSEYVGNAGVVLSVTAGGQVQYTSTNITGSSYAGTMSVSAKVIPQP